MQVAARPRRLTVGVSLATAGVLAIGPVAQSPHTAPLSEVPAISSAAVQLAAEYNPWQQWIDAFQTAEASAEKIGEIFNDAPAVLLQQFLVNQIEYIREVLQNPGNIGTVVNQMAHNLQSAFVSSTLLGFDQNTQFGLPQQSLDGWHDILRQSIPKILVEGTPPVAKEIVQQLLNVLSSPLSGVALGLAGPFISPVVALLNSIHDVGTALAAGDFTTAVHNIIDMPANMVGAVLNGANLNLDGLAPVLNKIGLLSGTTLHNLNIQFGGLLSAGVTGVYEDGIGGSIFNAIGLNTSTDMMGFPLDLEIAGRAIGPIGALVSLGQILAKAIGWDGTGNPLSALFPQPAPSVTASAAAALQAESTTTSTNESPTALPNDAAAATTVTVSQDTGTEINTSEPESTGDADAGVAAVDDGTAPTSAGGTDDAEPGSAVGTEGTASGTGSGTGSGSSDDTDPAKSESATERRSGKPAATSVSVKSSSSDDGGSDSGASDSE